MAFNFTLENSVIENSEVFSHANGIMEDANIVFRGVTLTKTKLFADLNVTQFCSNIQKQHMDLEESASIQRVIKQRGNKKAFIDALVQHLISFTEGVAASIVASCIMP